MHNHEIKLKCCLHFKYNWIRSENSFKKNAPIWRGVLYCCEKNCKIIYNAKIELNENHHKIFNITWEKHALHETLKKHKNLKGNEKTELGLELCYNGTSNLQYINTIQNKGNY